MSSSTSITPRYVYLHNFTNHTRIATNYIRITNTKKYDKTLKQKRAQAALGLIENLKNVNVSTVERNDKNLHALLEDPICTIPLNGLK